ncbi:ORF48 [Felid gammaherpesvirus 1]|uniref:ORF48 n=1 Tax=Felid gammaherpesvirus 1 TaxID=2560468 RepID=A0A0M4M479_9GAMA|nr:ORF48 [Felis catus gammaherpesvirus 1]ALE14759.1 ORF48 [Felis catus gammaherpesvirus 1]
MEPQLFLPVPGVSSENLNLWLGHLNTFIHYGKLQAALSNLKTLFRENEFGFLASLVILHTKFCESLKYKHKSSLIEDAKKIRETAILLYKKLKDHEHDSDIQIIFEDCKQRLCLILEVECGCVECIHTINQLTKTQQASKPPCLTPHDKHTSSYKFLTWVHQSVVLNLDVNLLESEVDQLYEQCYPFSDFPPSLHGELVLLTSCLNFTLLFNLLNYFITLELELLETCLQQLQAKLNLNTDNLTSCVECLLGHAKELQLDSHVYEINCLHLDNSSKLLKQKLAQPISSLQESTLSKILGLKPSHSCGVQPRVWCSSKNSQSKPQNQFAEVCQVLSAFRLMHPNPLQSASTHKFKASPQIVIPPRDELHYYSDDEDEEPPLLISDDEEDSDEEHQELTSDEEDGINCNFKLLISDEEDESVDTQQLSFIYDKNKGETGVNKTHIKTTQKNESEDDNDLRLNFGYYRENT